MTQLGKKHWLFLIVVPLTILLDQWTKHLILERFIYGESLSVIPGLFNLTYVQNKGAAFGFMAGMSDSFRIPFFYVVPFLVLSVIGYLFYQLPKDNIRMGLALTLVIGGAIGNLADRVMHGFVVDFFDFYVGTSHYPAFNIADSAICVGLGIILLDIYLETREQKKRKA